MMRDHAIDAAHAEGLMLAAVHLGKAGRSSASELAELAIEKSDSADTLASYIRLAVSLFDQEMMARAFRNAKSHRESDGKLAEVLAELEAGPLAALEIAQRLQDRDLPNDVFVPGRTLYVLHKSLPEASDGYAIRSHGLARALLDKGADFVFMTRPGFPYDLELIPGEAAVGPVVQVAENVPYHRLARPMRSDDPPTPAIHMIHASFNYLWEASERLSDAILEHKPTCVVAASNLATALPAALAAHRHGLPFVYEVRGFWELTRESKEPGFLRTTTGQQEKYLESAIARSADHVITLTTPMKQELIARGVAPERITLCPNACDPDLFEPRARDTSLAKHIALPPDVPVIGYVGSFNPYEGLEDLIETCAALRKEGLEFRVILVGSEPPDEAGRFPLTDHLKRRAGENGLDEWLIMPGRVPQSEVGDWYSLIDVAPFPRKSLPVTQLVSPLKPLEALAMGKAVLVTDVGGMNEIVADQRTGLVIPSDERQALAASLRALITDAPLRERLGKDGRAWVQDNRTWGHSAQLMLEAVSGLSFSP